MGLTRLSGGVATHGPKALAAAATASATSSTVDSFRLAICSPVAGF